jgi:hypothetical protein
MNSKDHLENTYEFNSLRTYFGDKINEMKSEMKSEMK